MLSSLRAAELPLTIAFPTLPHSRLSAFAESVKERTGEKKVVFLGHGFAKDPRPAPSWEALAFPKVDTCYTFISR